MLIPAGLFIEESDSEARERIRFEPLVVRASGSANEPELETLVFLLHDVLSEKECETLKWLWQAAIEGTARVEGIGNRECGRAIMCAPEISQHCYSRVLPFLEKIVKDFKVDVVEESDGYVEYTQRFADVEGIPDNWYLPAEQRRPPVMLGKEDAQRVLLSDERSLDWDGSWKLHSVKESVSCLRYRPPRDFFSAHTDHQQSGPGDTLFEPVKSLFTGLLYLNSDFTGGNTNFLSHAEGNPLLLSVNPGDAVAAGAPGSFLFFFQQGMLHAGEALETGEKYVMRVDLFYKQVETTISPDRLRGLELLQETREQLAAGNPRWEKTYDKAKEFNKAVLRMSPEG
jgi:hypothetical protein